MVLGKLATGVPCKEKEENNELLNCNPKDQFTQLLVSTVVPPALTSAGTLAAFRDQNQTLMNVSVRSIAYLCD